MSVQTIQSRSPERTSCVPETGTGSTRANQERLNQMPRLSRNVWGRPDLARLVSTEIDYEPYVSHGPSRREPNGSRR